MRKIDFKKMIKQEPDFAEYAKTVSFDALTINQPEFLKTIYSFYESGLSAEQAVSLLVSVQKLKDQ